MEVLFGQHNRIVILKEVASISSVWNYLGVVLPRGRGDGLIDLWEVLPTLESQMAKTCN